MSAGVPSDDKNWPPFFPIIHHDIANEIPVHAQKLQYLAFASWLGMVAFIFLVCIDLDFSKRFLIVLMFVSLIYFPTVYIYICICIIFPFYPYYILLMHLYFL